MGKATPESFSRAHMEAHRPHRTRVPGRTRSAASEYSLRCAARKWQLPTVTAYTNCERVESKSIPSIHRHPVKDLPAASAPRDSRAAFSSVENRSHREDPYRAAPWDRFSVLENAKRATGPHRANRAVRSDGDGWAVTGRPRGSGIASCPTSGRGGVGRSGRNRAVMLRRGAASTTKL